MWFRLRVKADWLKEGGQKDDWTRAMMSALSFIVRESYVKNSQTPGKADRPVNAGHAY